MNLAILHTAKFYIDKLTIGLLVAFYSTNCWAKIHEYWPSFSVGMYYLQPSLFKNYGTKSNFISYFEYHPLRIGNYSLRLRYEDIWARKVDSDSIGFNAQCLGIGAFRRVLFAIYKKCNNSSEKVNHFEFHKSYDDIEIVEFGLQFYLPVKNRVKFGAGLSILWGEYKDYPQCIDFVCTNRTSLTSLTSFLTIGI